MLFRSDPARQFPSSSTSSRGRLLVGPIGWTEGFLMVNFSVAWNTLGS